MLNPRKDEYKVINSFPEAQQILLYTELFSFFFFNSTFKELVSASCKRNLDLKAHGRYFLWDEG